MTKRGHRVDSAAVSTPALVLPMISTNECVKYGQSRTVLGGRHRFKTPHSSHGCRLCWRKELSHHTLETHTCSQNVLRPECPSLKSNTGITTIARGASNAAWPATSLLDCWMEWGKVVDELECIGRHCVRCKQSATCECHFFISSKQPFCASIELSLPWSPAFPMSLWFQVTDVCPQSKRRDSPRNRPLSHFPCVCASLPHSLSNFARK